jgi:2-dehydropantoate 2-reductase
MHEVARIADAAGYQEAANTIYQQSERPKDRLIFGGKEPSMLTDVRMNWPLEVEAILGTAVKIAKRLKAEVPLLQLLYGVRPDQRAELLDHV